MPQLIPDFDGFPGTKSSLASSKNSTGPLAHDIHGDNKKNTVTGKYEIV